MFNWFRRASKLLIVGSAMLATIGFGSLGIVWLRVEISRTAEDSRNLEKEVSDKARELRSLNTKRAKWLNPASLKALAAGRLVKPGIKQQIFVNSIDFERMQQLPLQPHFYPRPPADLPRRVSPVPKHLRKPQSREGSNRPSRLALR